jgi:transcription initiation factor TFIIIB Brf1 subunit/transcription initiation factor TFIIB
MEAISSQVKEQQVVCKDCNFVFVDRIPKQDFRWKAATRFCAKCKAHFCGEISCEINLGAMCAWIRFMDAVDL